MRTVIVRLKNASEYFARTLPEYSDGGMLIPPEPFVRERELLMLQIEVRSTAGVYCFRGGVARKDSSVRVGDRRVSGMEIEFMRGDRVLIDAMLDDLATDLGSFTARKEERSEVPLIAELEVAGRLVRVAARDLGPGGVFVEDVPGVLVGDVLRGRVLAREGGFALPAEFEVKWAGRKAGGQGLGLRFLFRSRTEERRWNASLRRLARAHATQVDEERVA